MDRTHVNSFCARFPGAELSQPFGPGTDVWKVHGKIFAAIGSEDRGVSVKCADIETAEVLRDAGPFEKAPYFHRSWVLTPFETCDASEVEHRIRVSYDVIVSALPKKVQAALAGK